MRTRSAPGSLALHPVVLGALALWALNDHVLKAAFPGAITGKLSDLASLIAFPALASAACELWASRGGRRGLSAPNAVLLGWAIATALVMITIRFEGPMAEAYRWGLGLAQWPFRALAAALRGEGSPGVSPVALALDPTDALTAPAAIIPVLLGGRHRPAMRAALLRNS